jgi:hypothetical protein
MNETMRRIGLKYFLFILIPICGCKGLVKTGVISPSYDIKQSKEIGVFINEYIPTQTKFSLDGKEYTIIEAWEENYWYYRNQWRDIEKMDGSEGLIKLNSDSIYYDVLHNISCYCKNGLKDNYGSSTGKLTFEPVPKRDSLNIVFFSKTDSVEIEFVKKHL